MFSFADYSLQLLSPAKWDLEVKYPLLGEWHSKVMSLRANKLCFLMDFSAPAAFQTAVTLLSGNSSGQQLVTNQTVFSIIGADDARIKLQLAIQHASSSLAQIIVYVSPNMTLNEVVVEPSECSRMSKTHYFSI